MNGERQFRALLIGNWEYRDPDGVLGSLNGPPNDLDVMVEALTHEDFGLFARDHVQVERNLESPQIGARLLGFLRDATPSDCLLIYFSGHGERLTSGQLALCGIEVTHSDAEAEAFDTVRLKDWMDSMNRSTSTVIILDCCYAGQYNKGAGALTEDALAESFGSGTSVLASGGNEPAQDSREKTAASPFTAALAEELINPGLVGQGGRYLSTHDIYNALGTHKLKPPPRHNLHAQGTIPLAQRPHSADADPRAERPGLRGYRDDQILETVELVFNDDHVFTRLEGKDEEDRRDLSLLDPNRQAAVRRLCQLTDAVMRHADYASDAVWQRAVRKAWDCIGLNLFESTLPPSLRSRITAGLDDTGHQLLKIRLCFEGATARVLQSYPWEYFQTTAPPSPGPGEDATYEYGDRLPLALRRGVLIERSAPVHGGAARQPAATPSTTPSVGVLNALPSPYARAGRRTGSEFVALDGLSCLFRLEGADATWTAFVDHLADRPNYLVVFAPVKRMGRAVEIGFSRVGGTDWRAVTRLTTELEHLSLSLRGLVFVTFAAPPGHDTMRGTFEVGRILSEHGVDPVVFVCHAPGFETSVDQASDDRPETFAGLLIDALSRGEPLDRSVYYARDQILRRVSADLDATFGVPAYYATAPPPKRRNSRPGPRSPSLPSSPIGIGDKR